MNLKEENVKPGCRFIKKIDNTMVTVDREVGRKPVHGHSDERIFGAVPDGGGK